MLACVQADMSVLAVVRGLGREQCVSSMRLPYSNWPTVFGNRSQSLIIAIGGSIARFGKYKRMTPQKVLVNSIID